jgi:hypothetical protein
VGVHLRYRRASQVWAYISGTGAHLRYIRVHLLGVIGVYLSGMYLAGVHLLRVIGVHLLSVIGVHLSGVHRGASLRRVSLGRYRCASPRRHRHASSRRYRRKVLVFRLK